MPLYDYRCENCQKVTEIRHGFNETNSEACPHCGGSLKRMFSAAPIVFKGSGFYVTDSRPSSSSDTSSSPSATSTPSTPPAPSSSSESAA